MRHLRFLTAVVAVVGLFASVAANAAMMRGVWAGTISEAVQGSDYELATGQRMTASFLVNSNYVSTLLDTSSDAPIEVTATIFGGSSPALISTSGAIPMAKWQVTLFGNGTWHAYDNASWVASGNWSPNDIKFENAQVIPIPAALPMLLAGLGVLGFLRRR